MLLFVGRVEEHVAVTDEMIAIAERDGSPSVQWAARANGIRIAYMRGGAAAAEELNNECLQQGQATGEGDALAWWGGAACAIYWVRCECDTLADAVGVFALQYPRLPVWHSGHAWFLADAGR